MEKLFHIKKGVDLRDIQLLTPSTFILLMASINYAKENGLKLRITSLISDRKNANIKSVSTTHEEGRAIDIGVRPSDGWTELLIHRFVYYINRDYAGDIGAISYKDKIARAAIYHDVYGAHIHLQTKPLPGGSLGKFFPITRS